MNQPPPQWGPQQGGYGPPQQGYPPQGYGPQGYGPPPGYGYQQRPPQKPSMGAGKIILIILGVLFGVPFFIGVLSGLSGSSKSTRTADQPKAAAADREEKPTRADPIPPPAPPPPAMSVGADQLFADYQSNEVSADDKYKGKRLRVTGVVASIEKDFTGDVVIGLATSNEFMPIHVNGLSKAFAAKLSKGQKVTVTCEGEGMMIGSPILDNCGS